MAETGSYMRNQQNGGRRRGRGGPRPPDGGPGNAPRPPMGNRMDQRGRGNAAQMLEKYKNMARDATMQGDRITAEYYHQFADHYFRVLNENRPRFEEQRPRHSQNWQDREDEGTASDRDDDRGYTDGGDAPERGYAPANRDAERAYAQPNREPSERDRADGGGRERDYREGRREQGDRAYRNEDRDTPPRETPAREPINRETSERRREGADRERPARSEERPFRGNDRPQRAEARVPESDDAIALDVLPPSLTRSARVEADSAPPAPRRGRPPREPRVEAAPVAEPAAAASTVEEEAAPRRRRRPRADPPSDAELSLENV